jgi:hypothetical protein
LKLGKIQATTLCENLRGGAGMLKSRQARGIAGWTLLALAILTLTGWIIGTSKTFRGCIDESSNNPVIGLYRDCTGEFLHENGEAIIAVFTIVLSFSTIGLWISTYSLWSATKAADRPWVGPFTVRSKQLEPGNQINAEIVILNTGRTPALRMRVAHDGVILEKGVEPAQPNLAHRIPKALFPGAHDFYRPFEGRDPLSQADFDGIVRGTRVAWIIAHIEYFDMEGGCHHTNVCTRWDQHGARAFVPHLQNDAD